MDCARKDNIEQFQLRLAETITWCSSQEWSFQPQPKRRPAWNPPKDYHQIMDLIAWAATHERYILPGTGLRTESLRPPEITSSWQAIHAQPPPLPHKELMAIENAEVLRQWREELARLSAIDHADQQRQWQQHVEQLAIQRAALLQAQNLPLLPLRYPLAGGRLLVYNPDESTSDGAAYDATQGFMNGCNEPAWDTWLVYVMGDEVSGTYYYHPFDSYLLSWVPDPLIEMVQDAMDCNSDACHHWIADLDSPFIRQLRQAGLIL